VVTQSEKTTGERVPRADKLNLLRDILHLLSEMGGVSGKKRLFYETKKKVTKPEYDFSVASTFDDYLIAGRMLALIKITKQAAKITAKGEQLVKTSKFGERDLGKFEKSFMRSLLLTYSPFRMFISIGFCEGRNFANESQLYLHGKCPHREELMKTYMQTKGHETDREARTLLGWSEQIGLVEFDEYSGQYYLVKDEGIDLNSFLRELRSIYPNVRDSRKKLALIPELRTQFCCSMNTSRKVFDNNLLKLNEIMPSKVQLGKASSSRDVVRKFGIHGKTFYYYYLKLVDELV